MSFTNAQLAQKISDLIDYWSSFNEEYSNWLGGAVDGGPSSDGQYPMTNWAGAETLVKSPAKLQDDVDNITSGATAQANAAAASASAAATSESNAAASEAQATSDAAAAAASAAAASVDEGLAASSATVSTAQANLATDRVGYAEEWAQAAFETPVSVAAGGDGSTDFSALHWATVAQGFAGSIDSNLYAQLAQNETITGSWTFGADFFLGNVRFRQADSVIYPQTNDGATLGGGTNRFAAGYFTTLLAQTHLNMQTGEAIEDIADGWLRLNNNQSFSNGVYTPGNLRVESAFNVGGAATFEGYVNGALKVYESRQAAGLSLDTLIVDAVYHMNNATGAGHPAGDTLAYGNMMVFDNSDVHTQVYFSRHDDGRVYTRTKNVSDFTGVSWNRLWSDADFDYTTFAVLAGNTFSGNHTFNDGFQIGDSAGRVLVNDSGDGGTRLYMAGRNAGNTDWNWAAEFGWNQATQKWYFDDTLSVGGADITGTLIGQWNTAYGWGNHASAGYAVLASANAFLSTMSIDTAGSHITLRETDGADPADRAILEVNGGNFNIYLHDTTPGTWYLPFRASLTTGAITMNGDTTLAAGVNGNLEITGSGYTTNPTGIVIGQYTATIGYIQAPTGGDLDFWNSGTGSMMRLKSTNSTMTMNNKEAIDWSDTWLRLNQNGDFTTGVYTPNNFRCDGLIYLGSVMNMNDASGTLQVANSNGYVQIAPANTSFCHFTTDRAKFYTNKPLYVNGSIYDYNGGSNRPYLHLTNTSMTSGGNVTFSTSAASGGSSGDIWFQYT